MLLSTPTAAGTSNWPSPLASRSSGSTPSPISHFAAAAKYGVKTEPGTNAPPGAEVLAELAALIADGQLEVPIANVYPLAQVRQAYTELERRHTHGKIVLEP
jgi:NADPH:quinone reductase-like Zn-dependent oxidoreductase